MMEEDREAIQRMKADFEALAVLTERDFKDSTGYERRMNHYNTVYTAAIRNSSRGSEYPGYDVGEILYLEFHEMLTRYLLKYRDLSAPSDEELFQQILQVWEHYKVLMKWNTRAFAYLSRYYIVNHSKPSLQQVALSIFREQVFKKNASVVSRVTLGLLARERANEYVSGRMVSSAIDVFSSMSLEGTSPIYEEELLKPYIRETMQHYSKWVEERSKTTSAEVFLGAVLDALDAEKGRCGKYFSTADETRVLGCVDKVIVESPETKRVLLQSPDGFVKSLRSRDHPSLRQYYSLFSRRDSGVASLAELVTSVIEKEGAELSASYSADENSVDVVGYVTSMMQMQQAYRDIVSECFQIHFALAKAVRTGLERAFGGGVTVTNRVTRLKHGIPFCEWVAHYADVVLQHDETTVDDEIDRIVNALAYVAERDRFLLCARELMAERILFPGRKFNESSERSLIQRLRQRCGPASTAQLEGMLHDVDSSNAFPAMTALQSRNRAPPFEITLLVAKRGIWPMKTMEEVPVLVPPMIQKTLDDLQGVFLHGTAGRILSWSHRSSSAELVGQYEAGSQVFCVSGIQALVLLAFNTKDNLTAQQLSDMYQIPWDDLSGAMPPLLKGRVLVRQPAQGVLQPSDTLSFNEKFPCRSRRQLFPPTLVRLSVNASETVAKQVEEDRKPAMDACIVRVMKSRRTMAHSDLVDECQKKLSTHFPADVKAIKQRIEELIRKEYLERDGKDKGVYHYVA